MKLFYLASTDPALNLAMEELLAREAEGPAFMLWRNGPSIIVGKNQNTAAEIDGDYVGFRHIPVVRRITGGGAVYHDLGNINYSCVSLEREWGEQSAEQFTAPIVAALQNLGIPASFSGRNDILANGRKISGCARSVPRDRTLFHGTLLFDANLEVLSQALKPDPEKIRSKGIKSVRARVGNLKDMLPENYQNLDMEGFVAYLTGFISRFYGQSAFEAPSAEWLERAGKLAEQKYRTWQWNYGTSIPYEVSRRIRIPAGSVQVDFNVKDNKIASIRFSGDFFGAYPIESLAEALLGLRPEREEITAFLLHFPFQNHISGIKLEELATLLCI